MAIRMFVLFTPLTSYIDYPCIWVLSLLLQSLRFIIYLSSLRCGCGNMYVEKLYVEGLEPAWELLFLSFLGGQLLCCVLGWLAVCPIYTNWESWRLSSNHVNPGGRELSANSPADNSPFSGFKWFELIKTGNVQKLGQTKFNGLWNQLR